MRTVLRGQEGVGVCRGSGGDAMPMVQALAAAPACRLPRPSGRRGGGGGEDGRSAGTLAGDVVYGVLRGRLNAESQAASAGLGRS